MSASARVNEGVLELAGGRHNGGRAQALRVAAELLLNQLYSTPANGSVSTISSVALRSCGEVAATTRRLSSWSSAQNDELARKNAADVATHRPHGIVVALAVVEGVSPHAVV